MKKGNVSLPAEGGDVVGVVGEEIGGEGGGGEEGENVG